MRLTRGFTLIELLVVIAIIGILSSVVLASLNDARKNSRDAKRVSDIKQIQLALELFYDAQSSYPTTSASVPISNGLDKLVPIFMPSQPKDPSTGNSYFYAATGAGTGGGNLQCPSYHVGATLENKSHAIFSDDVDSAAGTACSGTDFDGTNDDVSGVFDLIP